MHTIFFIFFFIITASNASPSLGNGKPASQSSRPRSYSRPSPIAVGPCLSPRESMPIVSSKSPSNKMQAHSILGPSKTLIEPLDSPAFLKGDLNFTTFRERAALAIAEWGPSPTVSHFPASEVRALTPRRHQFNHGATLAPSTNHGLKVPSPAHHTAGHSYLPSPPPTPLTPGPYSRPQHREESSVTRRSSLKFGKRPRPCPLQLIQSRSPETSENAYHDQMDNFRNVRFADGSPLRGSTWHLTQYPARLASPPISAANLSLADLVELEAIKQSLGTWCGEMMGSPMRGSFTKSSMCSSSESEGHKSWAPVHTPGPISNASLTSSPISCPEELDDLWGEVNWPDSPAYDSDCDSEIFEGMH
ncbi:hypothetical protein Pst134EA_002679 [Puccinia striiformis f. sp. tritici]|uniref:hypothetical protein n=1 Tax=Puccinia striiformis f. sp. tritici TaxID=168172 RepID=UPI0020077CD5|nr:hypothetical protein Pst134EA_002679 [Puccinia striiformis f. sp. tritici]KAH9472051.1 hypothetical protein Pst134EA_002679 [Puccinia striiformis f. sp. tritici]